MKIQQRQQQQQQQQQHVRLLKHEQHILVYRLLK